MFSGTKYTLNLLTTDFEELELVIFTVHFATCTAASTMNVGLLQSLPVRFKLASLIKYPCVYLLALQKSLMS